MSHCRRNCAAEKYLGISRQRLQLLTTKFIAPTIMIKEGDWLPSSYSKQYINVIVARKNSLNSQHLSSFPSNSTLTLLTLVSYQFKWAQKRNLSFIGFLYIHPHYKKQHKTIIGGRHSGYYLTQLEINKLYKVASLVSYLKT